MAPVKVEFMFDFGSPNAYLAEKVIPEIERRTGVTFEYVPVLLGGIYKLTNNRSPGEFLAGIKNRRNSWSLRPSVSSAATTSRHSTKIRSFR